MQVRTQPLQLQDSVNCVTLHCLDVVLKTIPALPQSLNVFRNRWTQDAAPDALPNLGNPLFTSDKSDYPLIQFLAAFSVQISRPLSC